jgi:hypothetical protein
MKEVELRWGPNKLNQSGRLLWREYCSLVRMARPLCMYIAASQSPHVGTVERMHSQATPFQKTCQLDRRLSADCAPYN